MRLGVISDTHGLLRPEVFDAFAQVDHILHAGDIGSPELSTVTPTGLISGTGSHGLPGSSSTASISW